MALIFCDSFDHYAEAQIVKKWTGKDSDCTISTTYGRNGGYGMGAAYYAWDCNKSLGVNKTTLVLGCAIKWVSTAFLASGFMEMRSGTNPQVVLKINADGTLSAYLGNSATLIGTSTVALRTGIHEHVEMKVVCHSSTGSVVVRVNEVEVISVSGVNTNPAGTGYMNNINFTTANSCNKGIDDVYVDDADFLGDVRIQAIYPNGAGAHTDFDPSTGSNYQCVDEALVSDADYVSSQTLDEIDTYAFGNIGVASATIHGVQLNIYAGKDDSGTRKITPVVRPASTDRLGTEVILAAAGKTFFSEMFVNNPEDSAAWEVADVNGAEFGFKITT